MSPFLRAYFSRLSWTGEPDVSIDTLRELHLQHNSAIPFENLDVLLPREIHLDDGALEEKLIAARRGVLVLNRMARWSCAARDRL